MATPHNTGAQAPGVAARASELVAAALRTDTPLFVPTRPPVHRVVAIACVVAIVVLAGVATSQLPNPITLEGVGEGDIGPPIIGARLFLEGHSPYGVRLAAEDITLYPFTTSLVLSPLLALSPVLWAPLFSAIGAGLLAFGILCRVEPWRLLVLASVPFWSALLSVQWSTFFAAALLLPVFLPVAAVKPQLELVLALSGEWTIKQFRYVAALIVFSIAIFPTWPLQWIRQGDLTGYAGRSPVIVGAGVLLLSTVLLWRDARGRLLLAMSIVMQRYFYDQLLLFLIPRTPLQMTCLLVASWGGALVCLQKGWWVTGAGVQDAHVWLVVVTTMHLPCLAIVWIDRWRRKRLRSVESVTADPRSTISLHSAHVAESRDNRPIS